MYMLILTMQLCSQRHNPYINGPPLNTHSVQKTTRADTQGDYAMHVTCGQYIGNSLRHFVIGAVNEISRLKSLNLKARETWYACTPGS